MVGDVSLPLGLLNFPSHGTLLLIGNWRKVSWSFRAVVDRPRSFSEPSPKVTQRKRLPHVRKHQVNSECKCVVCLLSVSVGLSGVPMLKFHLSGVLAFTFALAIGHCRLRYGSSLWMAWWRYSAVVEHSERLENQGSSRRTRTAGARSNPASNEIHATVCMPTSLYGRDMCSCGVGVGVYVCSFYFFVRLFLCQ
jgi:hypothetical protein